MSEGNISVRDSLDAAMKDLGDGGSAGAPAVVETPVVAAPEPVAAETPATEANTTPEGPARGPDGKFAPKDTKAEASAEAPPAPKTTETAPAVKPEPQETETIRVPHALPAPLKAEFATLDAKWRDAFIKQEDSIKAFKDEQQPKSERLNRYDEIMSPRKQALALQGIDEFTAVKTLFAAQDLLESDPLGGIRYLAKSYNVSPQQIAQAFGLTQASGQPPGVEGQQAPTAAPDALAHLQPVLQRLQTLEQERQADAQRTESEKLASARATITDFAGKPENMYFENVKNDVAKRLEDGSAATLADAYEQAIWASPEIRPLLLKAQAADTAKNPAVAAAAKARNAAQASGSVTGSPSPGAVAPQGPIGTVRETLQAAMQELSAA